MVTLVADAAVLSDDFARSKQNKTSPTITSNSHAIKQLSSFTFTVICSTLFSNESSNHSNLLHEEIL